MGRDGVLLGQVSFRVTVNANPKESGGVQASVGQGIAVTLESY